MTFVAFLTLLAFLSAPVGLVWGSEPVQWKVISPEPHYQGDVVMVELTGPTVGTLQGFGVKGTSLMGRKGNPLRAVLPIPVTTPVGDHEIRWVSSETVTFTVSVGPLSALVHTLTVPSMTTKTSGVLAKENKQLAKVFKEKTPDWMGTGTFRLPYDGRLTSGFGESRVYNDGLVAWRHTGVDFGVKGEDKLVRAAQSGRIMKAEQMKAHGGTLVIDHGCGIHTVYLHLESFSVKQGQRVKIGDPIGVMGKTGLATGVHLHWGAKVAGVTVNPLSLLSLRWPEP